jgi:hypothetical protein
MLRRPIAVSCDVKVQMLCQLRWSLVEDRETQAEGHLFPLFEGPAYFSLRCCRNREVSVL